MQDFVIRAGRIERHRGTCFPAGYGSRVELLKMQPVTGADGNSGACYQRYMATLENLIQFL